MTDDNTIGHIFKTNLSQAKFDALVTKACRAPFIIELVAHDPLMIPPLRLFNVDFTTAEDRDRVRIAMRFVEKEQDAALAAAARVPVQTARLARA
jgi:hypothetical protein